MLRRVNLEITYGCNLGCGFCYLNRTGRLNAAGTPLDLAGIKAFVDSFKETDVDFYITGGEPFLRPDCLDILEHAKNTSGHCGVNTNGTLLDDRSLERLSDISPDYVIFSLHGLPETHDVACGKDGTFARVAKNIRKLSSRTRGNTEITVNCVLDGRNTNDLHDFFLICEDMGVHRVIFGHLQYLTDREAASHAARWRRFSNRACRIITPVISRRAKTDVALLSRQIESLARRRYRGVHFDVRPLMTRPLLDLWYNGLPDTQGGCESSREVLTVAPNGDIRACQLYDRVLGNVAVKDWRDVWWSQDAMLFRDAVAEELFPGCARCCQRFKISRCY